MEVSKDSAPTAAQPSVCLFQRNASAFSSTAWEHILRLACVQLRGPNLAHPIAVTRPASGSFQGSGFRVSPGPYLNPFRVGPGPHRLVQGQFRVSRF